ncbi:MAG: hypothetical protein ACREOR_04665, partial [Candidatus Binatia bacterium]
MIFAMKPPGKIGVMEYWSTGVLGKIRDPPPITPPLHYSITPFFVTPLLQSFLFPVARGCQQKVDMRSATALYAWQEQFSP